MLEIIIKAFWIIAPAYAANAFPPLMKGKKPIDMCKTINGKRILGDGKTIEGFIGGIVFGIFIGAILIYFQNDVIKILMDYEINLIPLSFFSVFIMSLGALIGDMFGSMIKRRLNFERGKSFPLIDQLDFMFIPLLFALFFMNVNIYSIFFLIIITPLIHFIANIIGYLTKVKKEPW